ncbi:MAG TPA: glycoside hydrolase family 130 protein [Actinomycetota bacterium]|nr:glycoside hydrolase family 130 protein [Actinomycetota bacterium]
MSVAQQASALVTRSSIRLTPDSSRVLATMFLPGEEMPEDRSRATAVIERVLMLSAEEVSATLADLRARFAGRHRDLGATFLRHYQAVAPRIGSGNEPPENHRRLIGAYFTHEESPEGAALTNPCMVAHPDQSGLAPGEVRFVLSLRAVGEGHVSSLEFRTGVIGDDLEVRIDEPAGLLAKGTLQAALYERGEFERRRGRGVGEETERLVLDSLPARFTKAAMEEAIASLNPLFTGRKVARDTLTALRGVLANNYEVAFAEDTAVDERILVPVGPTESHGIEDARFVRFVDDEGGVVYYATYTAYDGSHVVPQLLVTKDFRVFRTHQLSGPAAKNKGMALFPRRVGGRFLSLSRWDRESNSLTASDDGLDWGTPVPIQSPTRTWELIQIGNCGSPLETPAGWLVLTHGVGPMRTYSIGAVLLDLHDPTKLLGRLREPLLMPIAAERNGYVPNVVYSCGGLVHGDALVLPYGYGDVAVGVAVVDLPRLFDLLL